ncbi:helix-turn-helix domain-containing protein [Vallitalea okinawensis]|uniref:helix-turn-helix domain-containing protein n=1 Tax=Vallitalea okinawensis TaxID=2078660 RepID=UPI000CFCD2C2|nr:helix-turn-helix domain-containing protein [Vallitalea okinawensis]
MKSKHIKEHVKNTIEFIDGNIDKPLSIDDIAANIYLSKYHLQRLFKSITGKGLIEYTRSRKLTESLYELVNSDKTVALVSKKFGFKYEQSYTRAFKTEFSLSPSEFRQNPKSVNITPKADISLLTELENSVIIKPFHIFRPSFTLGGILNKVELRENEKNYKATNVAIDFFYNHRQHLTNAINPHIYYGYTYWDTTSNEYTYYLTSLEIDNQKELPKDFESCTVPASNYSVFRLIGFFPPEELTWRHLVDIWNFKDDYLLKEKPLNRSTHYQFEYIDMSICRDDYCELDLYIPVV